VKVKRPDKKHWESDKKPDYLKLSKKKTKGGFDHIIKFVPPKPKRKKK
jgi:hypothetical protein